MGEFKDLKIGSSPFKWWLHLYKLVPMWKKRIHFTVLNMYSLKRWTLFGGVLMPAVASSPGTLLRFESYHHDAFWKEYILSSQIWRQQISNKFTARCVCWTSGNPPAAVLREPLRRMFWFIFLCSCKVLFLRILPWNSSPCFTAIW